MFAIDAGEDETSEKIECCERGRGYVLRRYVSSGEQGPVDENEGAKKKNGSETRRWHAAPEAGVNALAGRENSDVCTQEGGASGWT